MNLNKVFIFAMPYFGFPSSYYALAFRRRASDEDEKASKIPSHDAESMTTSIGTKQPQVVVACAAAVGVCGGTDFPF